MFSPEGEYLTIVQLKYVHNEIKNYLSQFDIYYGNVFIMYPNDLETSHQIHIRNRDYTVREGSTVRSPIMRRIENISKVIFWKVFFNKKAFLTFVYSPNALIMCGYKQSYCRGISYAVVFFLILLPYRGTTQELDGSFDSYLQNARLDTLSTASRLYYLRLARNTLIGDRADSTKYDKLSKIVEISSLLGDSIFFHAVAKEGLTLAQMLGMPAQLGDAHWNLGAYYINKKRYDSSYVHYNSAYKYFTAANNDYYAGKMLYNMAYISGQTHDFTGAEILLYRAIKLFEKQHKLLQLYRCYNLLGSHADDMEEFEKSLNYYKKASGFLPYLNDRTYYELQHWNNLGVRLYKMESYAQAIPYFEKALSQQKELMKRPALYAKVLDNLAFCQFSLGMYSEVAEAMKRAMAIRDSIGDVEGKATSSLHLAMYYGKIGDTLQAIGYGTEALSLATNNYFTSEVLNALEVLAAVDRKRTVIYLQHHIAMDKSLRARDRNLRDKFTAIQYETDSYIARNEQLFRQRLWLGVGAIVLTLFLLLVYLNARQRSRTKELIFEREQQQYNEDLFLMAHNERTNLEKGRAEERQRISQELHDDIVARLFTLRFRWNSLKLVGESKAIGLHGEFLGQLMGVERDIRNLSHELRELNTEGDNFLGVLEEIVREKSEIGNFTYDFQCKNPADWEELPYLVQIHLRRLFGEVLQNIVKHAQATTVRVFLYQEHGWRQISIADNGKGFNLHRVKKGIGLKNLENRSRKLKGSFEIHSTREVGTIVHIRMPMTII